MDGPGLGPGQGSGSMSYRTASNEVMYGRSSIFGAMLWMFGLSFLLTILLGWIPFVGPFIGPLAGGYVGGRRAGTVGRALAAAVLPAILLFFFILAFGAIASGLSGTPVIGAAAAVIGAAAMVIAVACNAALFLAALVGGLVRQSEPY